MYYQFQLFAFITMVVHRATTDNSTHMAKDHLGGWVLLKVYLFRIHILLIQRNAKHIS